MRLLLRCGFPLRTPAATRLPSVDRGHKLPIKRQAEVLAISRGTAYYKPRPVSEKDLLLMRKLDELHLNYPFAGSRMLRDLLRQQGANVGRRHVGTLMNKIGIEAIYRRPNTSKPAPGHRIYPYLLRNLAVTRANQVWVMDLSYIPMARGFVYLAAVVDWFSRKILSWKLSITMDVSFCLDALEEALSQHERPDIFNTDQGSQFTSEAFTERLRKNDIQISMDGKGCWRDNVFVERIWRTIKYEEVYLRAYESVQEARTSLGNYIEFYNHIRPHSSLKGNSRPGPPQPAARSPGSLTKTEPPPNKHRNLCRQTEPPLSTPSGTLARSLTRMR